MAADFIKNIKKALCILGLNPAFLFKRIFLELRAQVSPLPKPGIHEVNGVLFNFDFDFSYKIKKMYFGTFQPIISEILKAYLKPGDTFIDVGANIGYFSLIGAGIVGKTGQVHSFEPVPEYFERLDNFAKINKQYQIKANQLALGDENATTKIFIKGGSDIGNNTFFPELLGGGKVETTAEVNIIRLDEYIKDNNLKNISLIKIDVEGFEFATLKGLSNYFYDCYKSNSFPAIVCEVVPEIYPKLGCKMEDLFNYMAGFSYYPYDVLNNKKKIGLSEIKKYRVIDVLFKQVDKK